MCAQHIVQIQTDDYGWHMLCTTDANNLYCGTHVYKLIVGALRNKYPLDNFRVLDKKSLEVLDNEL